MRLVLHTQKIFLDVIDRWAGIQYCKKKQTRHMVQGSLYYQPKQCTAIYAEILQNNYMYICCMFDPHKMCHLMTPVANQRTYRIIASKTSFGRNIKTLIIPAPTKNSETKSSKTKRFHSQNHRKNIPNVEKKTMPEASFGVVRCRLPGFPQPI